MKKMLDSIEDLMLLSEDDLSERLIDSTYNNANLRELVRRSIRKNKEYKGAFEYQVELNEKMEEKLERTKKTFMDVLY